MVGNDFSEFILDVFRVEGLATNTTKRYGGFVELALLDPVTWRLGQKSKTSAEDESPQELDGDGDTVRASIAAVLSRIDDTVGEQDTNGDAELVA